MTHTSDEHDSLMFKIALLSSTFLITGASATSSLLPSLRQAFPAVSKATLQSFFSITALPQFIALIAAAFLATKFGKRNVILFGALLWTISGLLPMVLNNFPIILTSRVFLGFSLGLIQPIGTSMIADLYTGEARNALMGIQSAVIGISGTVLTFAIGLLITINWRAAFLIYLIGLIVFALTLHFLPKKISW
ncbi:MFS transporter [Secundilactobacillus collinoides]|uniref:MFS transporter n=1 Tax=Secundilactobacillus collinoides TaxID=33960 RepID=UPI0006D0D22B|nr:MFS transporter [Secundilactobacillus collinoides]